MKARIAYFERMRLVEAQFEAEERDDDDDDDDDAGDAELGFEARGTAKSGWLLKMSANRRAGWQRRFLVLARSGELTYARDPSADVGGTISGAASDVTWASESLPRPSRGRSLFRAL